MSFSLEETVYSLFNSIVYTQKVKGCNRLNMRSLKMTPVNDDDLRNQRIENLIVTSSNTNYIERKIRQVTIKFTQDMQVNYTMYNYVNQFHPPPFNSHSHKQHKCTATHCNQSMPYKYKLYF